MMIRKFFISIATALLLLARGSQLSLAAETSPVRVVQIDLDYVCDADPKQQEANLENLVTRISSMNINTVFLQAFADPEGTGLASKLYFKNKYLPMRADLFERAVTELKARAHVKVFGWLPVLSFNLGDQVSSVLAWKPTTGRVEPDIKAYRRLSPFDMKAREAIVEIYKDMARQAPIDGILFHDDAQLSDFEDANPAALEFYASAGLPATIKELRSNKESMIMWTKFKTATLVEFTEELTKAVREYRPLVLTARNIYAPVALQPESEEWFAQNYNLFLTSYDYTAVMAMPKMEEVEDDQAEAWMKKLVAAAENQPRGLERTIFELQSVDWHKQSLGHERVISSEILANEMKSLAGQGAVNFGYYPDDFVTNTPDLSILHDVFAVEASAGQP